MKYWNYLFFEENNILVFLGGMKTTTISEIVFHIFIVNDTSSVEEYGRLPKTSNRKKFFFVFLFEVLEIRFG